MTACPIGRGDLTGYANKGCRCGACTTAIREYQRNYKKTVYLARRKRSALPEEITRAQAQVRTLVGLGWTTTVIADAAGISNAPVSRIGSGTATRPRHTTVVAIDRAYQKLTSRDPGAQKAPKHAGRGASWKPAPEHGTYAKYGAGCKCARCHAAAKEYWGDRARRNRQTAA
ncbi:hypothetical protein ACHABQ_03015 [Nesterenkonia aurantiaca]|uniref:hypothetical protein n=1 Tax=Nesterenkonia aurantiaca TaxID=1436010 RepID=UPI003EE74031